MPPREFESIPRDAVLLSPEEGHQKTPQFKSVGKAMELPLVADAVSLAKSTLSPLVETVTPVAEKVEEQVSSAVTSLDNLACGGIDQLTERVPLLRGPTPEVLETTKEVATSCVSLLAEYLASFTLAQIALKVGEASLSMIDSTLEKTGMEKKMPVNIGNVRREARALRRAGVRRAAVESSTAKTIGEVSLLGAVAEIMGVNFFLSAVGLQLVPSNKCIDGETATFDMGKAEEVTDSDAEDEMTLQQRLGHEKLDAYESDKDPDYSPSEASEDSMEYASDTEEVVEPVESAVLYEDEHATVIAEAVVEQEPVVVDTESGDVVDDETRDCELEDTTTLATLATPLIDTQGFLAVSAAVAALEAVAVSEKIVPKETPLTEDPAEVLESDSYKNAVVPEAPVTYETKKVIVTEATEEIEIVDIDNDEVCVVDYYEGVQIDERNTDEEAKDLIKIN